MSNIPEQPRALVIDANALIHRAWHALPPLTAPDGRVVNAIYGFASVLMKILGTLRPTHLVVCWDTPEPTYRHTANHEYKAQRVEQPDEFYAQIPLTKQVVEVMGGTNIELPGYEADDLLATFATKFTQDGIPVTLLTSDKDAWQLIDDTVHVMAFKKGVSETTLLDPQMLKEITGLTPEQIVDYKALRGDASDNLKGVPGIGEKTATDLLKVYGHLEAILNAAHDPSSALSPSVRQKLVAGERAARETFPLVRLDRSAPVTREVPQTLRRPVNEEELRQVFTALGFKTLLTRALGGVGKQQEMMNEGTAGRPKKKMVDSPTHSSANSPTATHLMHMSPQVGVDFFAQIQREGRMIVQTVEVQQTSLFTQAPAVALGSQNRSVLLTTDDLRDKVMLKNFKETFADPSIQKIGHGLKTVWHWGQAHELAFDGIEFDTEIAAYLLSAGDGDFDLASLATARLDLFLPDTDERSLFEIDAIRRLEALLREELELRSLHSVWSRFEKPLITILAEMETVGVLIDRQYFKGLSEDFRAEKQRLEQEMEGLAGEPFNPGSTQQLGRILFEVLKIPSKGLKRGKTGISTAASELEKLEGAHPIIEKVGQYREVAKLLSTYVEALPALTDAEGRIHTTYNQALAATGRLSSSNPNLQNIPIRTELGRKIRRGFVAPKGFRLVSCDYSQIELRVIAALAKDDKMLDAFRRGLDIHTATAAAIWNVPLEQVTKDQRRAAKTINFGIIYGQGPHALAKGAGISFEQAKQFIAEYFHVYSGVRDYLETTKALARAQGYVETLFGRRRRIPDINSPLPQLRSAAERMAINMPVQGTSADVMKLAMVEVAKQLPKISKDTRLLLQVHDELVLEVPEDEVETVTARIVDIMQTVEKIGVPIVVEAKQGKNWDEMEKIVI